MNSIDTISNPKIQNFLQGLEIMDSTKFQIVQKILELFFQIHLNLDLDFKYGGIIFILENQQLGGIFAYKDYISLEFSHGNLLEDSNEILEGSGKHRRHLKFRNIEEIKTKKTKTFVQQLKDI